MKRAVIYARYSSDKQTEQSIEGQVRECTKYAERNDILIVGTYIDRAVSGTTDDRLEFQHMLRDAQKQAWDMVLVYKLDRFSRNKYEMAIHRKTLTDNHISLVSSTEYIPEGPEGIILETLLEGMAEYYSRELAQKVSRGMKETRLKGNYTGGIVTYGYCVKDGKYAIDEYEGPIVLRIFEMYAAGIIAKKIIEILTEEGILNRSGKPFSLSMLYRILENEKYTGRYTHPVDGVYENLYPQIVPIPLFEQVQDMTTLAKPGRKSQEAKYLLKLKMKCGYCGGTMISDAGKGRDGEMRRYYACGRKRRKEKKCSKTAVKKEAIEQVIVEETLKIFNDAATVDKLADDIMAVLAKRNGENIAAKKLEESLKTVDKKIRNLMNAIEEGIVTATTKQRLQELEIERDELRARLVAEESHDKLQITKSDIKRFIRKAVEKDPALMIKTLIKEIILYDDKIEIYYNYTKNKSPDDDDHRGFCFYEEIVELEKMKYGKSAVSGVVKMKMKLYA